MTLLFLAVRLLLVRYVEPKIASRLQHIISSTSEGICTAEIENLRFDILASRITLGAVRIRVDSARYRERMAQSALPPVIADGVISRTVIHVRPWTMLFSGALDVRKLVVRDGNLRFFLPDTASTRFRKPGDMSLPELRSVRLDNMHFSVQSPRSTWQLDSCNARITLARNGEHDGLSAEVTSATAENITFLSADSLDWITAHHLVIDSGHRLEAEDVLYAPAVSRRRFYELTNAQRDFVQLQTEKVTLTGFRPDQAVLGNLVTDTLAVRRPRFHVWNDTFAPVGDTSLKSFPSALLAQAPFVVRIRTAEIDSGMMIYTERDRNSPAQVAVTFEDVTGKITNITNDSAQIASDSVCVADLSSRVFGSGVVHSRFTLNLASETEAFSVSVDIAGLDASHVTALTLPMTDVRITSFRLDAFHADIAGDERYAGGNVTMRYRDLAIDPAGTRQSFWNDLGNGLAVRHNNPASLGGEQIALNRTRPRLRSKSFFHLIWKVMFDGVREIVLRDNGPFKL